MMETTAEAPEGATPKPIILENFPRSEAEVEKLLSTRLLQGFLLLELACPNCSTPLVKHDEDTTDDNASGLGIQPIPNLPFCVKCPAHVITSEEEVGLIDVDNERGSILVSMQPPALPEVDDDVTSRTSDDECNEILSENNSTIPTNDMSADHQSLATKQSHLQGSRASSRRSRGTQRTTTSRRSKPSVSPSKRSRNLLPPSAGTAVRSDENSVPTQRDQGIAESTFKHEDDITNTDRYGVLQQSDVSETFVTEKVGEPEEQVKEEGSHRQFDELEEVRTQEEGDMLQVEILTKVSSVLDGLEDLDIVGHGSEFEGSSELNSVKVLQSEEIASTDFVEASRAEESSVCGSTNSHSHSRHEDIQCEDDSTAMVSMNATTSEAARPFLEASPVSLNSFVENEYREFWPPYEERRNLAAKVLSAKMIQGMVLCEEQCRRCSMPLMGEEAEIPYCVVCPHLDKKLAKRKVESDMTAELERRRSLQKARIAAQRLEVEKSIQVQRNLRTKKNKVTPMITGGVSGSRVVRASDISASKSLKSRDSSFVSAVSGSPTLVTGEVSTASELPVVTAKEAYESVSAATVDGSITGEPSAEIVSTRGTTSSAVEKETNPIIKASGDEVDVESRGSIIKSSDDDEVVEESQVNDNIVPTTEETSNIDSITKSSGRDEVVEESQANNNIVPTAIVPALGTRSSEVEHEAVEGPNNDSIVKSSGDDEVDERQANNIVLWSKEGKSAVPMGLPGDTASNKVARVASVLASHVEGNGQSTSKADEEVVQNNTAAEESQVDDKALVTMDGTDEPTPQKNNKSNISTDSSNDVMEDNLLVRGTERDEQSVNLSHEVCLPGKVEHQAISTSNGDEGAEKAKIRDSISTPSTTKKRWAPLSFLLNPALIFPPSPLEKFQMELEEAKHLQERRSASVAPVQRGVVSTPDDNIASPDCDGVVNSDNGGKLEREEPHFCDEENQNVASTPDDTTASPVCDGGINNGNGGDLERDDPPSCNEVNQSVGGLPELSDTEKVKTVVDALSVTSFPREIDGTLSNQLVGKGDLEKTTKEGKIIEDLQKGFESEREYVSKEIGKKMLGGWTLLDKSCPVCVMPLMKNTNDEQICVLCEKSSTPQEKSLADHQPEEKVEEKDERFETQSENVSSSSKTPTSVNRHLQAENQQDLNEIKSKLPDDTATEGSQEKSQREPDDTKGKLPEESPNDLVSTIAASIKKRGNRTTREPSCSRGGVAQSILQQVIIPREGRRSREDPPASKSASAQRSSRDSEGIHYSDLGKETQKKDTPIISPSLDEGKEEELENQSSEQSQTEPVLTKVHGSFGEEVEVEVHSDPGMIEMSKNDKIIDLVALESRNQQVSSLREGMIVEREQSGTDGDSQSVYTPMHHNSSYPLLHVPSPGMSRISAPNFSPTSPQNIDPHVASKTRQRVLPEMVMTRTPKGTHPATAESEMLQSNEALDFDDNSSQTSVNSEAIDALLSRIEETKQLLEEPANVSDSAENHNRLSELLANLASAAEAMQRFDELGAIEMVNAVDSGLAGGA